MENIAILPSEAISAKVCIPSKIRDERLRKRIFQSVCFQTLRSGLTSRSLFLTFPFSSEIFFVFILPEICLSCDHGWEDSPAVREFAKIKSIKRSKKSVARWIKILCVCGRLHRCIVHVRDCPCFRPDECSRYPLCACCTGTGTCC